MKDLSIIIVNYNVKDYLMQCIDSIYNFFSGFSFEIIVIDNNSSDGSVECLRTKYHDVKLICNKNNIGFPKAINQGLLIAEAKYVLLLNPDTFFIDSSFGKMFQFIKTEKENTLVAPKMLNQDFSLQISAYKNSYLIYSLKDALFLNRIINNNYPLENFTEAKLVDNVIGAAMLFPKKLTEKVGCFDEDLFWAEDMDFCFRIRKSGGKVYYFPESSIVHYWHKSADQNIKIHYSNFHNNRFRYIRKHFSTVHCIVAESSLLFHVFTRIFVLFFLMLFQKKYMVQLNAYLYTLKNNFSILFTKK